MEQNVSKKSFTGSSSWCRLMVKRVRVKMGLKLLQSEPDFNEATAENWSVILNSVNLNITSLNETFVRWWRNHPKRQFHNMLKPPKVQGDWVFYGFYIKEMSLWSWRQFGSMCLRRLQLEAVSTSKAAAVFSQNMPIIQIIGPHIHLLVYSARCTLHCVNSHTPAAIGLPVCSDTGCNTSNPPAHTKKTHANTREHIWTCALSINPFSYLVSAQQPLCLLVISVWSGALCV